MHFSKYLSWAAIATLSSGVSASPINGKRDEIAAAKPQQYWLQVESRESGSQFNGYYIYLLRKGHTTHYRFWPASSKAAPPYYTISEGGLHTKFGKKEHSTKSTEVGSFLELVPGQGKTSDFKRDSETGRLVWQPAKGGPLRDDVFRLCPSGDDQFYVSLKDTQDEGCEKIYIKMGKE